MHAEIDRAIAAASPVSDTVFIVADTTCAGRCAASVIASIPVSEGAESPSSRNPDDVTVEMLRTYRSAGVNRVSLGVQSMSAHVLVALGRTHDQENVAARSRRSGLPRCRRSTST